MRLSSHLPWGEIWHIVFNCGDEELETGFCVDEEMVSKSLGSMATVSNEEKKDMHEYCLLLLKVLESKTKYNRNRTTILALIL